MALPDPLPDDPKKWDEWRSYTSSDYYKRLGLSIQENPSPELIEENCRRLLIWWQKKLPLKTQPSNPIAQILREGFDEAPMRLSEARAALLDPATRQAHDATLLKALHEQALIEFDRFCSFILKSNVLRPADESRLHEFGLQHGIDEITIASRIEEALAQTGTQRVPEDTPAPKEWTQSDPEAQFVRMLQLSGLGPNDMTDDQRDAFINMAENLGIDAGRAEDLVDEFLDSMETRADEAEGSSQTRAQATYQQPTILTPKIPGPVRIAPRLTSRIATVRATERTQLLPSMIPEANPALEYARYPSFVNSIGCEMLLVPTGAFHMGSNSPSVPQNETPITRVHITRFYLARFPVTNAQFELFDPTHRNRRLATAGDHHPVVHVSSSDAVRFCEWLSARERRKYRLPTEAEWEYAARGTESRDYPWGSSKARGDVANFADAHTKFPWSDRSIDDGWAETSPVGSFPAGAGPFRHEDLAGNVWEWCLDFLENYKGGERVNPRGPSTGVRRVLRGGSWRSRFQSLRGSCRNSNLPAYSCDDIGFRIACETD